MKNLKIILRYNKCFFLIGLVLIIYVFITTKIIKYNSVYDITTNTVEGTIKNYSINGDKLTINVRGKEEFIATYYIKSAEEKEKIFSTIHLGDKVTLEGTFNIPSDNTIPNTFNYKKYLYNKRIYYTFNITDYKFKSSLNIHYKIKDLLLKRAYRLDNNGYFLIFLLGDKSLIDSDELKIFQDNGISHLLAISGMHIGVLLSVFSYLLNKFKENTKLIFLSIILIFFCFLTGFSASVLRASLFFILKSINKKFNFHFNNLQILFITAAILIFLNPFIVYDLGFIYSFSVTGGIIYYQDKIKGRYIIRLLKLSLITFLFSLPITALLNYEINITSIIFNIVFIPLISLIVYPLSLITYFFSFLNPFFTIILKIIKYLNVFCSKTSIFINIPKLPMFLVICFYIFLLLFKRNKKFGGILLAIIIIAKIIPKIDYNSYIYYLDVGQGDCAVLISPFKNEVIIIDTGGKITYEKEDWAISNKSYNLSDNTIIFLKSLGITQIDYLILSHGDQDHAKEAINIVNNLKVKNVIFNNDDYNSLELEIINDLKSQKIKYYKGLKKLNTSYYQMYFLNTSIFDNENDNSSVIYFTYYNSKFLFMGDAGIKREKEILEKYNIEDITFLKVGHHGSNTSTSEEFINSINPKYSLISVGENNRYGHPKENVLDILSNSKIYRTDLDGSIEIKLQKNGYKIKTYPP